MYTCTWAPSPKCPRCFQLGTSPPSRPDARFRPVRTGRSFSGFACACLPLGARVTLWWALLSSVRCFWVGGVRLWCYVLSAGLPDAGRGTTDSKRRQPTTTNQTLSLAVLVSLDGLAEAFACARLSVCVRAWSCGVPWPRAWVSNFVCGAWVGWLGFTISCPRACPAPAGANTHSRAHTQR